MTWKLADTYRSFTVTEVTFLEELGMTLRKLTHIPTGAKVLHLACDDPENLFCLSFQTRPSSSNGIAHILEHIVLCGSQNYPVKDPFFAMTRRSLNTFMNALTGSDFTCYPAASQVKEDFYNLLHVYLDAVFHPVLQKESFLQEGHRLELQDPTNLESPLIYQGVVFNEMKGALASAESRMWNEICKQLLPDLTYAHVSGGTPQEIPSLSYEELTAFHQTYYHPSQCLFFFYGNLPLEQHLDVIEEKVLSHANHQEPLAPIPLQRRFTVPRKVTSSYPQQPSEPAQSIVTFAWLTAHATDQETLFALFLLDALMMDNDASLLKLPLTQAGLCLTAESFFDPDMSEVPYGIICKGCDATQVDELEELLLKTLTQIASSQVAESAIESALHQLELSRTEIDADSAPFGLTLFMRSALTLQHGGQPEKALQIHAIFDHLRLQLKDPLFLKNLIHQYLIDNPHRVTLTLVPDAKLLEKEESAEKQQLEAVRERLSLEDKQKIALQMNELQKFQEKIEHQDLSCLPQVTLDDVPPLSKQLLLQERGPLYVHESLTNGIVYADLVMDLPALTEEELPWAQLVATLFTEIGVGEKNYLRWLDEVQSAAGFLTASLSLYPHADNPSVLKPALVIRSKAIERNSSKMLNLMKEVATKAKFHEKERIAELIKQLNMGLQQSLMRKSLKYASLAACSSLSLAGTVAERWSGLSYMKWIHELAGQLPHNLDQIISSLEKMYAKITSFQGTSLIIGCQKTFQGYSIPEDFFHFPSKPFTPWNHALKKETPLSQARAITSAIGFNCQAFAVCPFSHPAAPFLSLASQLMEHLILHPQIREQGGAYGASASYIPSLGHFTFQSYRDPHLASSLEAFKDSIHCISKAQFSNEDLTAAKLEVIQSLDAPLSPSLKASTAYAYLRQEKTWAQRQAYRDRLLNASCEDVAGAVKTQLLPLSDPLSGQGVVVSLGNQSWLEKEIALLQKPLPIISI
ncbi:MAG: insulinase family protein [Candidatus Rhabdochlamydia sp.]